MKTAVQWLKEQYIDRGETIPSGVFQEALEKEKEQIVEFGYKCRDNQKKLPQDIFNQTYNQNK